ncbi:AAA family ATPase [Humibacter sp. RRB41]|uniref:AAA family ATPase n=1 Tax=Humibacter sp. RRB41 TaxID=2919946 RepID=UPI001FA972D2|nr:AAA family ATPase [Humibacter sp. RRB41]
MSLDVERVVIASLLLDGKRMREVVAECTPRDFADPRLAQLFSGMARMVAQQEPIDTITVSGHLLDWGVRGIEASDLFGWTSQVPHAANVSVYAAQIRRNAMQRALTVAAKRIEDTVSQETPDKVLEQALEDLRGIREDHIIDELTAVPLLDVLSTDAEYDWAIDGLLERKDRVMITGPEGFGKSTLVRQLAITAAAGIHPFREWAIPPARVLVIDAENTEKQWARETRKWANSAVTITSTDPSENMQLACVRRLDLSRDIDLGQVHRLIDQNRPDVLFIGPLYRLIPRAINSDDDAAPLLANLDTIRDRGIALVIEAHAGHATNPKGERDMRPRGSAALMGWPEFGIGLRRNTKNPLHADLVRWRGDRDQRAWPAKLGRAAKDGQQRWPWRPVD